MKTKITLALAMLGLSSIAFAGAPGNPMVVPTGVPVIAPDSTGTWSFGLEALYMESNTSFQYASYDTLATDGSGTTTQHNQSVHNDWNWGVEADISYMFPGSSRDISASYTYLNQDGSDSVTDPDDVLGVTNFINNGGQPFNTAKGDVDQTLNAATLTFGQLLTVGDRLSLHPFGGVQFADIDNTDNAYYYGNSDAVPPTTGLTGSYKQESDFEGAGPRAGIDASVHLGSDFSIIGTFAGALLVGNMDSQFAFYNGAVPSAFGGTVLSFKNDSYTALVPELDAKIALDYMYAFNPKTSMNIQVGYEVVNYFNAESNNILDAFNSNSVSTTSDFNYNGPYLRLQLNVA
jgi:hypothetical protein